jgi:hypothetical protein
LVPERVVESITQEQALADGTSIAASESPTGKTPSGGSVGGNSSGTSGQRVVREIDIEPMNWLLHTKTNYTKLQVRKLILQKLALILLHGAVRQGGAAALPNTSSPPRDENPLSNPHTIPQGGMRVW